MAPIMSTTMKAFYALALAALASANLVINNGCSETIHIDHVGGEAADDLPSFDLPAGASTEQPFFGGGSGVSVKIARPGGAGVLQLEYSLADHLYWDLSDLDGGGAGVVASPFRDAHVRITPTGNGANQGQNKCFTLDCPAGVTCQEAYQDPNQEATRACPADADALILDLCLDGDAAAAAPPPPPLPPRPPTTAGEDEGEVAFAPPNGIIPPAADPFVYAEEPEEPELEERQPEADSSRKWRGPKMIRGRRI